MTAYKVYYGKNFKKHIQKFSNKKEKINICINKFLENPFDPSLKTHKLSGQLKNIWSFSVDFNLRVTFRFINVKVIQIIDIGTHGIYM